MQSEALTCIRVADNLAAIINPRGSRERASGRIDRGEGAVVQDEAVAGPAGDGDILADDLTAIIDPVGGRGEGSGHIDTAEG